VSCLLGDTVATLFDSPPKVPALQQQQGFEQPVDNEYNI
jgi:hypothetical protein